MSKLNKLKILFFLAALIISGLPYLVAHAQQKEPDYAPLTFKSQVGIPFSNIFSGADTAVGEYIASTGKMVSNLLPNYIKAVYDYGLAVAGILATIVLMGGGLLWLTSTGNESRSSKAKELITGGLSGLVLLLSSWLLLNTINPQLLEFKPIVTKITNKINFVDNLKCEWKCLGLNDKCEGGGENDSIKNSSALKTMDNSLCGADSSKVNLGGTDSNPCKTGEDRKCCCGLKTNIVNKEELKQALACLKGDAKTLKADYTNCQVDGIEGYCKTQPGESGTSNISKCLPCKQIGEICDQNIGDGDYACADSSGKCGAANSGGDCNASSKDSFALFDVITWLSSSSIGCNATNSLPFGIASTYVQCKCK